MVISSTPARDAEDRRARARRPRRTPRAGGVQIVSRPTRRVSTRPATRRRLRWWLTSGWLRPTWAMSSATLASPSARRRTMRRRFTSARALWKARSSRRSSGWRTIEAMVERNRAGVGTGGWVSGSGGGRRASHQRRLISTDVDAIGRRVELRVKAASPAVSRGHQLATPSHHRDLDRRHGSASSARPMLADGLAVAAGVADALSSSPRAALARRADGLRHIGGVGRSSAACSQRGDLRGLRRRRHG